MIGASLLVLLPIRNEIFVIRFGEIYHQILHRGGHEVGIPLVPFDSSFGREFHEARDRRLRRNHRSVLDDTAIFDDASTSLQCFHALFSQWKNNKQAALTITAFFPM